MKKVLFIVVSTLILSACGNESEKILKSNSEINPKGLLNTKWESTEEVGTFQVFATMDFKTKDSLSHYSVINDSFNTTVSISLKYKVEKDKIYVFQENTSDVCWEGTFPNSKTMVVKTVPFNDKPGEMMTYMLVKK